MKNKKCLVFETLENVQNMEIIKESESNTNDIRLKGVFGVAGVRNNNNRVYSKENYGLMVESLQKVIATEGCLGELEHPQSMNIDLNNVSHKIESIEMNEDGTVTGTILLLNTDKGKNAKAIVEAGVPLYISSRAAGSIDEAGNVTLTTLKTYDLVGTPGFSQAKLNLAEGQKFESLNENLCVIYEDDLLGGDDDSSDEEDDEKKDDEKKDDKDISNEEDKKEAEEKDDDEADDKSDDDKSDDEASIEDEDKQGEGDAAVDPDESDKDDNKNTNNDKQMEEIKKSIDTLSDRIEKLEADLHIAKESLRETVDNIPSVNYEAIQTWVTEEFGKEVDEKINALKSEVDEKVEATTSEIAEGVEKWVTEEFAPEVQNWVCEEFAPQVEGWINEELMPTVESWITEEFGGTINDWVTEEVKPAIENQVNENVSSFLESQKNARFEDIDAMLEALDNKDDIQNVDNALEVLKEHQAKNDQYRGVYVVENMPSQYQPQWEMLNEERKNEILMSSRMYDFTKAGVLESFWANVKFENNEVITESATPESTYQNNIVAQMMRLRKY